MQIKLAEKLFSLTSVLGKVKHEFNSFEFSSPHPELVSMQDN